MARVMGERDAPTRPFPARELVAESRRGRLRRLWARRWFRIVLASVAALVLLAVGFEAGHAYAEGVRTLPQFIDHLREMASGQMARWRGPVGKYMWSPLGIMGRFIWLVRWA